MDTERASPTSFRLARDAKELLTKAAERERRTLTSMLEVMILEWCRNRVALKQEKTKKFLGGVFAPKLIPCGGMLNRITI